MSFIICVDFRLPASAKYMNQNTIATANAIWFFNKSPNDLNGFSFFQSNFFGVSLALVSTKSQRESTRFESVITWKEQKHNQKVQSQHYKWYVQWKFQWNLEESYQKQTRIPKNTHSSCEISWYNLCLQISLNLVDLRKFTSNETQSYCHPCHCKILWSSIWRAYLI